MRLMQLTIGGKLNLLIPENIINLMESWRVALCIESGQVGKIDAEGMWDGGNKKRVSIVTSMSVK